MKTLINKKEKTKIMKTLINNKQKTKIMKNQMNELLKEKSYAYTNSNHEFTVLDFITNMELSPTQRLIHMYLLSTAAPDSVPQREIVEALGFTNKSIRENLEHMLSLGYVTRGDKIYTWYPTLMLN